MRLAHVHSADGHFSTSDNRLVSLGEWPVQNGLLCLLLDLSALTFGKGEIAWNQSTKRSVAMSLAQQEVDSAARYSPDQLDRELRSRVAEYLFDRNEHAFRSLHVEADHGTVTLTGLVRSYYEKQVAASCLNVSGVLNLINNLTVPEWETDDDEFPFTL